MQRIPDSSWWMFNYLEEQTPNTDSCFYDGGRVYLSFNVYERVDSVKADIYRSE